MRWLLVEARDHSGPLLLLLRGDQPLPDYAGFKLGRVHTFDSKEQAQAAHQQRQAGAAWISHSRPARGPRP